VVDGEEYKWTNGGFVLFDDTFEHFAVNESDLSRAILFMDVLRPMPPFWTAVAKAMILITRLLPYFREPMRRHRNWERSFYRD
jgi:beta-hydroxylase